MKLRRVDVMLQFHLGLLTVLIEHDHQLILRDTEIASRIWFGGDHDIGEVDQNFVGRRFPDGKVSPVACGHGSPLLSKASASPSI